MNDDENKTLKKKQKKSNQIIMVTYNEVPKYQQDNEYIRKGYLKNCDSIKKVFKSLFMIHNETVNILLLCNYKAFSRFVKHSINTLIDKATQYTNSEKHNLHCSFFPSISLKCCCLVS